MQVMLAEKFNISLVSVRDGTASPDRYAGWLMQGGIHGQFQSFCPRAVHLNDDLESEYLIAQSTQMDHLPIPDAVLFFCRVIGPVFENLFPIAYGPCVNDLGIQFQKTGHWDHRNDRQA
jgi:hypothetical protein